MGVHHVFPLTQRGQRDQAGTSRAENATRGVPATCLLSGGSQQEQLAVLNGDRRATRGGRGWVGLDVR